MIAQGVAQKEPRLYFAQGTSFDVQTNTEMASSNDVRIVTGNFLKAFGLLNEVVSRKLEFTWPEIIAALPGILLPGNRLLPRFGLGVIAPYHVGVATQKAAEAVSVGNRLMQALYNRRASVLESEEAEATAKAAMAEVAAVIDEGGLPAPPHLMLSAEGLVMMQWEAKEIGVLLLFAGDGTVTLSRKSSTTSYIDDSIEYGLSPSLPREVFQALTALP